MPRPVNRKVASKKSEKRRVKGASAAKPAPMMAAKDDARTIALLWSSRQKTGRSGLTLSTIVNEAVKIADSEGLDAVSMRRIAEVLEVGTMSLYTHVPGKLELTDLMVDAVHGELYSDVEEVQKQPGGYRERLRYAAERNRALYLRHPWLLEVPLGRPVLGPSVVKNYEAELRALDGIGLSAVEMDSIRALLVLHVQSTARTRASNLRAQQTDGMTEVEWWTTTVPLLQRVMTGSFPLAGRVGREAGQSLAPGPSDEHLFRFGLELICDAVDTLVARSATLQPAVPPPPTHGPEM